jgi:hypothetical protein
MGKRIDWYQNFWYPFVSHWGSRIALSADPTKLVFVEGIPNNSQAHSHLLTT